MENERLVEFIDGVKKMIIYGERDLKKKKELEHIIDVFGGEKIDDLVSVLSQEALDYLGNQKEDEITFYKSILARAEAELKKAQ